MAAFYGVFWTTGAAWELVCAVCASAARRAGGTRRGRRPADAGEQHVERGHDLVAAADPLIEAQGRAADRANAGLDGQRVVEPRRNAVIDSAAPHREDRIGRLAEARDARDRAAHHLGAAALGEFEVVGVIDDPRSVGVLVVDPHRVRVGGGHRMAGPKNGPSPPFRGERRGPLRSNGRVRWVSASALESPTSPRPSPPPNSPRGAERGFFSIRHRASGSGKPESRSSWPGRLAGTRQIEVAVGRSRSACGRAACAAGSPAGSGKAR